MATPVSYVPLEGGFMSSIGTGASFKTTDSPSLFTSSSFLWTFAFVVIVVTASFRYAYAGMLRMQATEKGISDSKAEFKRVTYGLLGVFGLWLILFTINKDMLTGNVSLGGLRSSPITTTSGTVVPVTPPIGDTPPVSGGNEATVRQQFSSAGIAINKSACSTPSSTNCTDVGGLQSNIISAVLALKSKCKCDVQITGGSEKAGHSANSNHTTGNAVDIALTSELTSFFSNPTNNSAVVGNTPPCNIKYAFSGLIFWDEAQGCDSVGGARHFHASVTGN